MSRPLLEPPSVRSRKTREEHRAETRARLFGAAWELFKEKGYHDVTTDEVTARAGYSTTPLYTVFGSKERLFAELFGELTGRLLERSRDFGPLGTSMREAVRAWVRMIEASLTDQDYRALVELGSVTSTFPLTSREDLAFGREIGQRHQSSLATTLAAYAEAAGETLPMPADRLADLLLATSSGLQIRANDPAERHLRPLYDLVDLLFPIQKDNP